MRYPDYLVHYNKNHDKKTGRFTFGDGNGDGVSPDSYRTKELDSLNDKYGKDILAAKNFMYSDVTNDKNIEIINFGINALEKGGFKYGPEYTDSGDWSLQSFLSEDMFDGRRELAYLIYNGYDTKDKLKSILEANNKLDEANFKYKEKEAKRVNEEYGYNRTSPWMIQIPDSELPYESPSMFLNWVYRDLYVNPRYDNPNSYTNYYNRYIDACIEVAKEMEHTDMEYSDYLVHFNPYHNPKTGRFDFALGKDKLDRYHGKSDYQYAKDMYIQYREKGNSKFKSAKLADASVRGQRLEVQQYRANKMAYDRQAKKALKAYEKGDEEKYIKTYVKLLESYKSAKAHEILSKKDYELGQIFVTTIAQDLGLVGGRQNLDRYMAALSEAKAKVNLEMINKDMKNPNYREKVKQIADINRKSMPKWQKELIENGDKFKKAVNTALELDKTAQEEGFDSWDDVPEDHWLKRD